MDELQIDMGPEQEPQIFAGIEKTAHNMDSEGNIKFVNFGRASSSSRSGQGRRPCSFFQPLLIAPP